MSDVEKDSGSARSAGRSPERVEVSGLGQRFETAEDFAQHIATEFLGKSRAPRLAKRIVEAMNAAEVRGKILMRRAAVQEIQVNSGFNNAINGKLRKVAEAVGKLPVREAATP